MIILSSNLRIGLNRCHLCQFLSAFCEMRLLRLPSGQMSSMRLRNDILAQAMLLKTEISIARQHDTAIISRKGCGGPAPTTGSIPMMRCTTG